MAVPHMGLSCPSTAMGLSHSPRQVHSSPAPALQQVQLHPGLISQVISTEASKHPPNGAGLEEKPESAKQKEPPAAVSSMDTHLGEKILQFSGKSCRYSV